MSQQMTTAQMRKFVEIAQMGIGCGLTTPPEWLLNYTLHQMNFEVYADIPANYKMAIAAFAAFYRGCASSPEEDEALKKMSDEDLCNYWAEKFWPSKMTDEPHHG